MNRPNFLSTALATLIDLFLPLQCAGCAAPGAPLCIRCGSVFDGPFLVRRDAPGTPGPPAPPIHALATYRDTARTVILCFKERGRRDLARPLGRMMAAVLPTLDGIQPLTGDTWWLVPAPSTPRAARRRGGSHTLALARETAATLAEHGHNAAVAPALQLLSSARDSVGLDADARRVNLTGRVKLNPAAAPPPGTAVVLLDDIVTTGATAAACTEALVAGGIEVRAVLSLTAT